MTRVTRPTPAAQLESDLSEVALALFAPGTLEGTLQRVVTLAVATIDGCDAAGIFLVEDEKIKTVAASDPVVLVLDRLQLETDEGPCLDAVTDEGTVYAEDLSTADRWPQFAPEAVGAGIRSTLAFRLSTRRASALNLYARLPAAFGATDRAKGLIFATLAGIALDAAEKRADEEKRSDNLHRALQTRELIGQAQGILMERERITGDQAFDVLRRASQHLNIKVREVARTLVETGETPPVGTGPAS